LSPFKVQLRTTSATSADLALTVEFVHDAGGTDVSVFQSEGRPRVEFSLEADDADDAARAAHRVRLCLTKATPLLAGGWIIAWIVAG
jgi:hypothetical protein